MNRRRIVRYGAGILMMGMMGAGLRLAQAQAPAAPQSSAPAQPSAAYQPKFAGDPARSESEAQALGYMRMVLRAQHEYKKRHDKFADSLEALAGPDPSPSAWRTRPTAGITRPAFVRTMKARSRRFRAYHDAASTWTANIARSMRKKMASFMRTIRRPRIWIRRR